MNDGVGCPDAYNWVDYGVIIGGSDSDETSCGACSEHCPTQAVHMVPYKGALTIPEIRPEICVGCGGCEYVCPAIPFKAIYVEGLPTQNRIELEREKVDEVVIDDFGF